MPHVIRLTEDFWYNLITTTTSSDKRAVFVGGLEPYVLSLGLILIEKIFHSTHFI